jgi:hypothetical protein
MVHKAISPSSARLMIVGILVVQFCYLLYFSRNNFFWGDDFYFFMNARQEGMSIRYVTHDVSGQIAPGYRLLNFFYINVFGLKFWPARFIEITLELITLLIMLSIARRHHAKEILMVAVATLMIFSPLYAGRIGWWASALHVLPATAAALGSIALSSRTNFDSREKWLGGALYLVALLFFSKAFFSIFILLAVRMTQRNEISPNAPVFHHAVRALNDISPQVMIASFYLLFFWFGHYGGMVQRPSFEQLGYFVLYGWNYGFLIRASGLDYFFPGRLILLNLVIVIIVLNSIKRRRTNSFLWVGFGIYFLLGTASIGVYRIAMLGVDAAASARYHSDTLVYFLIVLILAYRPNVDEQATVFIMNKVRRWPRVIGGACFIIAAGVYLSRSSERARPSWYYELTEVRAFVDNVGAGLAEVGPSATIANTRLPAYILGEWASPVNTFEDFSTLFLREAHFVPRDAAAFFFGYDGRLQRSSVPEQN